MRTEEHYKSCNVIFGLVVNNFEASLSTPTQFLLQVTEFLISFRNISQSWLVFSEEAIVNIKANRCKVEIYFGKVTIESNLRFLWRGLFGL